MELKDKVAFAGAIAVAALAVAKLIADKETKISDVRRDWITGFRNALCECLAEAHVIAGRIRIRRVHLSKLALADKDVRKLEADLTEHWAKFRHSFQMTMLHLNFSESSAIFLPRFKSGVHAESDKHAWEILAGKADDSPHSRLINRLAAPISEMRDSELASAPAVELASTLLALRTLLLGQYDLVGEDPTYAEIEASIAKATMLGTLVIEPEWDLIKRGESMHRFTIVISASLVAFGVYKLITA